MHTLAFISWLPDTAWYVLAGTFALLAGIFLISWIRGDRARGNLRCHRCWYTIAPANAPKPELPVTCPECGRAHATIKQLARTRRRRSGLPAVAALGIIATACWYTPDVRRDGLLKSTPTWLLATYCRFAPQGYSPDAIDELVDRLWTEPSTPAWLRRYGFESVATEMIRSRRVWPKHTRMPVHSSFGLLRAASNSHRDAVLELGAFFDMPKLKIDPGESPLPFGKRKPIYESADIFWVDPSSTRTAIDVSDKTLHAGSLTIQIDAGASRARDPDQPKPQAIYIRVPLSLVDTPDEAITADRSSTTDAAVRAHLHPRFYQSPFESRQLGIRMIDSLSAGIPLQLSLGVRVEFLREGKVVATATWRETPGRSFYERSLPTRLLGQPDAIEALRAASPTDPAWRVRLIGDAMASLMDFDADRYWPGVIELPLSELFTPEPPMPALPATPADPSDPASGSDAGTTEPNGSAAPAPAAP